MTRLLLALLALAALCAGCGGGSSAATGSAHPDTTATPARGACRDLTRAELARTSNASPTVDCASPHTAATYAAGSLPERFDEAGRDDTELADWAYQRCTTTLQRHLGTDQSTTMRSLFSWVWFRPSTAAWDAGARWYRCDLVAGGNGMAYVDLPTKTTNLLRGPSVDDDWMVCARGGRLGQARVACSQNHAWRAVTTVKVGEPSDSYPGDADVEDTSSRYCSESVKAWLHYPAQFSSADYAYTWFGETEWRAGNRLSVCWARTAE
ncbi:MAG: septum formation family protein [Nocardioides sp.]|uniref:septum formation family protein n=1 Tax=Nocardioides sp. TaxID=35761 RepID=UPI0039E5F84D